MAIWGGNVVVMLTLAAVAMQLVGAVVGRMDEGPKVELAGEVLYCIHGSGLSSSCSSSKCDGAYDAVRSYCCY